MPIERAWLGDFGIDMDRDEFIDKMVDEFNTTFRAQTQSTNCCYIHGAHRFSAMRFAIGTVISICLTTSFCELSWHGEKTRTFSPWRAFSCATGYDGGHEKHQT